MMSKDNDTEADYKMARAMEAYLDDHSGTVKDPMVDKVGLFAQEVLDSEEAPPPETIFTVDKKRYANKGKRTLAQLKASGELRASGYGLGAGPSGSKPPGKDSLWQVMLKREQESAAGSSDKENKPPAMKVVIVKHCFPARLIQISNSTSNPSSSPTSFANPGARDNKWTRWQTGETWTSRRPRTVSTTRAQRRSLETGLALLLTEPWR